MATRQYDFIVGPEQSTPPTVSDPTDDDDLMTKGFADDEYAHRDQFFESRANDAAVAAIAEADREDGQIVNKNDSDSLWRFDSGSSDAADNERVIVPSAGTGRFHNFGFVKGGISSSLVWNEVPGAAPTADDEFDFNVYKFSEADAGNQELITLFKVPESYVSTTQIFMEIAIYSPSASNTILMETSSFLIREGTDAVDIAASAHASTNSALTNAVANQYRKVTLDITDADGELNTGVAATAGDVIKIRLKRDAGDTDTADIRFIEALTEVRFI